MPEDAVNCPLPRAARPPRAGAYRAVAAPLQGVVWVRTLITHIPLPIPCSNSFASHARLQFVLVLLISVVLLLRIQGYSARCVGEQRASRRRRHKISRSSGRTNPRRTSGARKMPWIDAFMSRRPRAPLALTHGARRGLVIAYKRHAADDDRPTAFKGDPEFCAAAQPRRSLKPEVKLARILRRRSRSVCARTWRAASASQHDRLGPRSAAPPRRRSTRCPSSARSVLRFDAKDPLPVAQTKRGDAFSPTRERAQFQAPSRAVEYLLRTSIR